MSNERARKVLEAVKKITDRGEHFSWAGLTHISAESGLPRATVYRYTKKLIECGLLTKAKHSYHGDVAYRYRITRDAREWLSGWQTFPLPD